MLFNNIIISLDIFCTLINTRAVIDYPKRLFKGAAGLSLLVRFALDRLAGSDGPAPLTLSFPARDTDPLLLLPMTNNPRLLSSAMQA